MDATALVSMLEIVIVLNLLDLRPEAPRFALQLICAPCLMKIHSHKQEAGGKTVQKHADLPILQLEVHKRITWIRRNAFRIMSKRAFMEH